MNKDITVNELLSLFNDLEEAKIVIDDLLKEISILKNEYYNTKEYSPDYPYNCTPEFLELTKKDFRAKISFIYDFIKDTYPENIFDEIKKEKEISYKNIVESQEKLAKAWEGLRKREESLNKEIAEKLSKEL